VKVKVKYQSSTLTYDCRFFYRRLAFSIMAYTADTLSKIKAVDFAMESFARYKDEGKRQEWLSFNIDAVQYLGIYFEYSKAELREEKKQIIERLNHQEEMEINSQKIQINAQEIEMKKLKHQEEMGSKVKGEKK
jgi:hypothetical protein